MDKRIIKMIVVLTATAVLSGGILALVYKKAEPLIEANRLRELKKAIFLVLPEAKDYKTVEKKGFNIYIGIDENGSQVGYAFVATGPGFQGKIKMMVGLANDMKTLTGMKVLEQVETPGLGNRISEDTFQGQFKGLSTEPEITYVKNKKPEKPNEIQAITGATISSKSVVAIVNKELKKVVKALKEEEVEKTYGP